MVRKKERTAHKYTYKNPVYLLLAIVTFITFLYLSWMAFFVLSFRLAWLAGKLNIVKTTEDKNRITKEYNKMIKSLTLNEVKEK